MKTEDKEDDEETVDEEQEILTASVGTQTLVEKRNVRTGTDNEIVRERINNTFQKYEKPSTGNRAHLSIKIMMS